MRGVLLVPLLFLVTAAGRPQARAATAQSAAPEVVDRIVARIEDDIITLSEVRELGAYQQLVEGRAEPEDRLRSELVEQWVINSEATAARFPAPASSEVDREVARIQGLSPSAQAYRDRLSALGLSADAVRRMVTREIFLARYLDYKFRPSVQVSDEDIAKYYREDLVPSLGAKGQKPPALDVVTDQIRELLVQRGIDDRAASWLDQTKSHLKVEIEEVTNAPSGETPRPSPAERQ